MDKDKKFILAKACKEQLDEYFNKFFDVYFDSTIRNSQLDYIDNIKLYYNIRPTGARSTIYCSLDFNDDNIEFFFTLSSNASIDNVDVINISYLKFSIDLIIRIFEKFIFYINYDRYFR